MAHLQVLKQYLDGKYVNKAKQANSGFEELILQWKGCEYRCMEPFLQ